MRRHGFRLLALTFSVALLMAACGSDDGSNGSNGSSDGGDASGDRTMTITDFTYDPDTLELPSGQEITLQVTNNDDVEHSFTLDDDSVSQDIESGDTQSVTLNLSEGIGWHCEYHPDQMTGTITIS
jgi:plastocyanin